MASPGWYPDPSGQPNRFRFWDGQSWSQETTADPYNTPPPGQAPPQPAPPQQPQQQSPQHPQQQPPQHGAGEQPTQQAQLPPQHGAWPQANPGQQGQQGQQGQWAYDAGGQSWAPGPTGGGSDYGSGKNRTVMVVVGVVVIIALIIGGIFGAMALTGDDDDDKSSDDKSSQSSDPSESGSESTDPSESGSESTDPSESGSESTDPSESGSESTDPSGRPSFGHACVAGDPLARTSKNGNGRVAGGGLSFKKPKAYKSGKFQGVFTFADDVGVVANQVEDNWVSTLAVGGLTKGDGYESAEEAADTVMNCMAASDEFYSGFQSRKDLMNENGKVNGKPAWRIRSEIRIEYEGIKAEGDVADVIVVKLGKQKYALFVGVVPIGDQKRIKVLDQTISSLKVK